MFDTDWLSTLQMAPECLFADHLGPKAQSPFRHLISRYSVPPARDRRRTSLPAFWCLMWRSDNAFIEDKLLKVEYFVQNFPLV
jgi:hypothetical protein